MEVSAAASALLLSCTATAIRAVRPRTWPARSSSSLGRNHRHSMRGGLRAASQWSPHVTDERQVRVGRRQPRSSRDKDGYVVDVPERRDGCAAGRRGLQHAQRFTVAQVNAGATRPAGDRCRLQAYRMVSCSDHFGRRRGWCRDDGRHPRDAGDDQRQARGVRAGIPDAERGTDCRAASGAAILADGASYAANDASTAITIGKTGATITTATHFDVILSYAIEAV
jgi:hypothetical protein